MGGEGHWPPLSFARACTHVFVSECDFTVPQNVLPSSLFELANDQSFTASVSSVDQSTEPHHSRLNSDNGWIPSNTDGDDLWLQVDLGVPQFIAMIELSPPGSTAEEYVTKALAYCSLDGLDFYPFMNYKTGKKQVFRGSSEVKKHKTWLHLCRFVRIVPKKWVGRPALRWNVMQCPCKLSFGYTTQERSQREGAQTFNSNFG